jgi:hypothetical protein
VFATFTQTGIPLHINDQIDLKQIALKVEGGAATVEVTGAPLYTYPSSFQSGFNLSMIGSGGCLATGQCALAGQNGGRYIVGTPDETPAPLVVCDPRAHLAAQQIFNAACFQSPTVGNNKSYRTPYIHGPMSMNSDLSIFKNFKMG